MTQFRHGDVRNASILQLTTLGLDQTLIEQSFQFVKSVLFSIGLGEQTLQRVLMALPSSTSTRKAGRKIKIATRLRIFDFFTFKSGKSASFGPWLHEKLELATKLRTGASASPHIQVCAVRPWGCWKSAKTSPKARSELVQQTVFMTNQA